MRPHKSTAARGFTLVEVLVAVAVVAITLAAGLKAAGALTDNAQRLSEVVNAQWCADNALTNLRLNKQFPGIGDADFDCNNSAATTRAAWSRGRRRTPTSGVSTPSCSTMRASAIVTLSTVLGRY